MGKQYKVKITKYALEQMEEIKRYIADELLAPHYYHFLKLLLVKFRQVVYNQCRR